MRESVEAYILCPLMMLSAAIPSYISYIHIVLLLLFLLHYLMFFISIYFYFEYPTACFMYSLHCTSTLTCLLYHARYFPHHQQRTFGALTPCCGARTPGLCTIASSAPGASRAPGRHRPRSLPPGRPNTSTSRRNWGVFARIYGAHGALTPAFWDSGVRAPSVRTVAF